MPLPSSINDLSTSEASNSPAGSESPITFDNYLRWHASFIAALRDVVLSGAGNISTVNITYSGTLTGSTGVINIGTNQIYKDSSGNVGLGNTPAHKLTLYNGGAATSVAHFANAVTGPGALNGTLVGTDSAGSGIIMVQQAYPLISYTASVERSRIDASGNTISVLTNTVPTLATNRQLVFNRVSDTEVRLSMRGDDGTTRSVVFTIA